jgi:hypothetical protein
MVLVFDLDTQIYQEILQLPPSIPCILICMESPIYSRYSHDISVLSNPRWHRILTWNRTICLPNVLYYDIPIADAIPLDFNPNLSAISQKGVAIANPAKSQEGFLLQRDALYLELAAHQFIDLYGNHWPYMPERGLYGSTPDKISTITHHSYSLVIENYLCPGYVTEKLADSILAKRPAIYYGDITLAQHRFPNTFVSLKELSLEAFLEALAELSATMQNMKELVEISRLQSLKWCNSFVEQVTKSILHIHAL